MSFFAVFNLETSRQVPGTVPVWNNSGRSHLCLTNWLGAYAGQKTTMTTNSNIKTYDFIKAIACMKESRKFLFIPQKYTLSLKHNNGLIA